MPRKSIYNGIKKNSISKNINYNQRLKNNKLAEKELREGFNFITRLNTLHYDRMKNNEITSKEFESIFKKRKQGYNKLTNKVLENKEIDKISSMLNISVQYKIKFIEKHKSDLMINAPTKFKSKEYCKNIFMEIKKKNPVVFGEKENKVLNAYIKLLEPNKKIKNSVIVGNFIEYFDKMINKNVKMN